MKADGTQGHDEVTKWCLDCDRETIHVERVGRCSTSLFRCSGCGRES